MEELNEDGQKAQTSSYKCHGYDVPCSKYNELCCALYMKVANRVNPKSFKNYIYISISLMLYLYEMMGVR